MSIKIGYPVRLWGQYGEWAVFASQVRWWEIHLIPRTAKGDLLELVSEKDERHPACVRDVLRMLEKGSLTDLEHLKVLHDSGHVVTLSYLFDDDDPIRKWEVMLWGVPDDDGWSDVIDFQTFEHTGLPSEVIMEAWAIVGTMEEQA